MYEIVRREQFSPSTFLWEVRAPDVAKAAQAGHFVMLHLHEGSERIPLTVADFDRELGTITLVVQAVGKTTREMLQGYRRGDTFSDFAGPLGRASEVENLGHVVLVGGGLGVAPIFPQLRAYKQAGCRTTAILGFRTRDLVFWEDRFRPWCDELIVCTDDGSHGRKGFVTAALEEVLAASPKPDRVVAVGPLPMMKACSESTRPHRVSTVVSLNAIMVDGTGMCGACRVRIEDEIKFACVDGPEFDAHRVDFGELMQRQRRFSGHETVAKAEYDHVCKLERELFEQEKRNYKKIKELPPEQVAMPEQDAGERATNFSEVNIGYSLEDALAEAHRCIQCRKPTCIAGCPVAIDIPTFIRHLLIRDLDGALSVIRRSNLFPSVCGRVCPQESQCEAQCIIGKKVEPVAIGRLERYIGDHATATALARRASDAPTGKVAIVGSGPGGLACAADLAQAGVDVTVFEALHVVGGVLSYGIPGFRLPREIIEREVQGLRDLGVEIQTNKIVGKTFSLAELLEERGFDAVFVATGAGYPMFLNIPGEHAGSVYSANEFLTRINLMGGDRFPHRDTPVSLGKSVVVLGAGNTAMDCLRVSRRLGAERVRCLYRRSEGEAPARAEELRHAKEEGIEFHWLRSPVEILTDDAGDVCGIRCQEMVLGPPDDSGRRRPQAVPDAYETFECDTVIYALGTRANPIIAQSTPDLKSHRGGYIDADTETQATSMKGVFAGGDIVTGGATVILAMGAGRRAAAAMLRYIAGDRRWPPAAHHESEAATAGPAACPKCHRALEDEEQYICCADARLSWECRSCQKVYEGFAFPYGLCAACGGELAMHGDTEVSSEEGQRAIRAAFEIELGGMSFYAKSAEAVEEPELADLFRRLVEMEKEHLATLARRYHVDPPQDDETPSLDHVALYRGLDRPKTGEDLLKMAVHLEERARDFFAREGGRLERESTAWKLYRELEAEENEHITLLKDELARYRQGEPGLL